jgi:single-strand DNA-binding protein
VTDISLAINRVWNNEQGQKQEDTIFVDVTLWGRQAELAQQYLSKGRCAYIEGRLQMDTWDDKETGKKRSKLKVVGDQLQFMPDGKGGSGGSPPPSQGGPQASQQRSAPPHGATAAPANEFQEEDDIPF